MKLFLGILAVLTSSAAHAGFKIDTAEVDFESDEQKTRFFAQCLDAAQTIQKKIKAVGAELSITALATPFDIAEMDGGDSPFSPRHLRCTLTFVDESESFNFVRAKTRHAVPGLGALSPGKQRATCQSELKTVATATGELYRYSIIRSFSDACVTRTVSLVKQN